MKDPTDVAVELSAKCVANANRDSAAIMGACVRDHLLNAEKPIPRLAVVSEQLMGISMSIHLALLTGGSICIGDDYHIHGGRALTAWQVFHKAFCNLMREAPPDDEKIWSRLAHHCVHEIEGIEKGLKESADKLAQVITQVESSGETKH